MSARECIASVGRVSRSGELWYSEKELVLSLHPQHWIFQASLLTVMTPRIPGQNAHSVYVK